MKRTEKIKIVHVMHDGTIRNSVAGYVIPAGNGIYEIVRECKKAKETSYDYGV